MNYSVFTVLYVLLCILFYGNISWFEIVLGYEIDRADTFFAFLFLFFLLSLIIRSAADKPKPKGYYGLNTLEEYVKDHPESRSEDGSIKCYKCNGTGIDNRDVEGTDKNKRRIVCSSCGRELYRIEYKSFVEKGK